MQLQNINRIYFLGIGGIGMSAIARYFKGLGCEVAGYDRTPTALTNALEAEGIMVHFDDDVAKILPNSDLIIYTPAIPKDHKGWNFLRESGIPFKKRAEVLGIISRGMKCMAVAGTHGKTTTTTILTHILRTGGIDCTAFLGGISNDLGSNFIQGKSEWVVVEADEFDRSFLQLNPDISVVNSMDPDHLDIYGTAEELRNTYRKFAHLTKEGGHVFFRSDLDLLQKNLEETTKSDTFNIENGDYQAKNIRVENGFFVFDLQSPIENIDNIKFTLPRKHNVLNATGAIAAAQQIGVTGEAIKTALASFKGIHRRFEFVIRNEKTVLIDDYAHHPEELRAAISAAKMLYPNKKITGVFQPHLYSRTRDFVDGFAESLDRLDECLLLPIYPARELPMEGVETNIIFEKMQITNKNLMTKEQFLLYTEQNSFEVLLMLGAGDIDKLVAKVAGQDVRSY